MFSLWSPSCFFLSITFASHPHILTFFLTLYVCYTGNATMIQPTALPLPSLLSVSPLHVLRLHSTAKQCLSLSARLPFSLSFSLPFPCPQITENSLSPPCLLFPCPSQTDTVTLSAPLLSSPPKQRGAWLWNLILLNNSADKVGYGKMQRQTNPLKRDSYCTLTNIILFTVSS